MRLRSCFVVRFGFRVSITPKLWSRPDDREVTSDHSRLCRTCRLCVWLRAAWPAGTRRPVGASGGPSIAPRPCLCCPAPSTWAPSPRSLLATARWGGLGVTSCPSCSLRLCRRRPPRRLLRASLAQGAVRSSLFSKCLGSSSVNGSHLRWQQRRCLLIVQLARNLRLYDPWETETNKVGDESHGTIPRQAYA